MRTVLFLSTFFLFFLKAGSVEKNTMHGMIGNIATDFLDQQGTQGLSIGIVREGKMTSYCFGNACESPYSPVSENNVFEIGSITKVFTGILFADQVLVNNLDPKQKLSEFVSSGSGFSGVTLEQLATHSSGLPRIADNFWNCVKDQANPYAGYTEDDLKAYLSNVKPVAAPGEKYLYSNVGMGILGWVLSNRSNLDYETLVKERISDRLGLKNTSASLSEIQKKNLSTGYSNGKAVQNWDFQNCTSGQGSLRSDINDMMVFAEANIHPENTSISEAIRLSQEVHYTESGTNRKMGYGWHIGAFQGEKYLEHTGGTGGYRSFIGVVPSKELAVVILSNSDKDVAGIGVKILQSVAMNPHL